MNAVRVYLALDFSLMIYSGKKRLLYDRARIGIFILCPGHCYIRKGVDSEVFWGVGVRGCSFGGIFILWYPTL